MTKTKTIAKIMLAVTSVFIFCSLSWAISWERDMTSALAKAKNENRPVMADFYTDWCHWCRKLDADVYEDAGINKLAGNFVCVKINCGIDKGAFLKYGLRGYPTVIFFDPAGVAEETVVGYRNAQVFAGIMNKVLGKVSKPAVEQEQPIVEPLVKKAREAGEFELAGIMGSKAIVNDRVVAVGGVVGGATVIEITENHVKLLYKDRELTLNLFCPVAEEGADTIYLNNGRSVTGIIYREGKNALELETDGGLVSISRSAIKRVDHASSEALNALRAAWAERRSYLKSQAPELEEERGKRFKEYGDWVEESRQKKREARKEGEVTIRRDPESHSILVDTLLNGEVKATLVIDTGAAVTVLSKHICEKLGIDLSKDTGKDIGEMRLAGGGSVRVKMIILKSLNIEGIEERNVAAAALLEEKGASTFKDGLLGRSFLSRFNMSIDLQNMKMTVKKIN